MTALSVQHLAVGYGSRSVLQNICIDVSAGELVGVIGPNGCGKSTLLKAVTRVIPFRSGRVTVDGQDIARMSRKVLARHIAIVPQSPTLPEAFLVREVVMLGRTPHLGLLQSEGSEDIEVTERAMAQAQCDHLADRRIGELSGGERQRVVLARALTQQAPVLLLDEPTAHLDISHQLAVFRLIRDLCRSNGLAALAVVHDLTLAGMFCDRLNLITGGIVLTEGVPAEVLTSANIARAFDASVHIGAHPRTGTPMVFPDLDA